MKSRRVHSHPATTESLDKHSQDRSAVWASLTIFTFIIVYLSSIMLEVKNVLPFIYGASAMFCVLILEGILHGKLWLFEDGYKQKFEDPHFIWRIVVFSGGLLLILETAYIMNLFVGSTAACLLQ